MQIFKRVNNRSAQNLVEFMFVLPIILFMTLCIFEAALYWQDVNAIYNLNAEINANTALADTKNMIDGAECTAAATALAFFEKRDSMISINNPTYSKTITDGVEPFAMYRFTSPDITMGAVTKPQISLWVDCRSPFEKGITTQIEFYHKNVILEATIPRFDGGEPIVVIPNNLFIASPKLNTLRQY